jgi:F420-dependent oxidoreductase-like protein
MIGFGVTLNQEEFDFDGLKRATRDIEDLGYDSVWLYDHFYPMSKKTSGYILEPYTVLPSLAAETSRVRLGVLVTCNLFRFPSVLAKIAATVDVMSKGRLEFGMGAGWYEDECVAYGIPFPGLKTRVRQLGESVEIIKRIWSMEEASYQGKYYSIKDLVSYPKPIQKPHPPIWMGGKYPPLLEITARHADYANFNLCEPAKFQARLDELKAWCSKTGRNYEEIQKTYLGTAIVVDKEEDVRREALKANETKYSLEEFIDKSICGTPAQCVKKIQQYIDMGVTYFILHFFPFTDLKAARPFMDKVAPDFGTR